MPPVASPIHTGAVGALTSSDRGGRIGLRWDGMAPTSAQMDDDLIRVVEAAAMVMLDASRQFSRLAHDARQFNRLLTSLLPPGDGGVDCDVHLRLVDDSVKAVDRAPELLADIRSHVGQLRDRPVKPEHLGD